MVMKKSLLFALFLLFTVSAMAEPYHHHRRHHHHHHYHHAAVVVIHKRVARLLFDWAGEAQGGTVNTALCAHRPASPGA